MFRNRTKSTMLSNKLLNYAVYSSIDYMLRQGSSLDLLLIRNNSSIPHRQSKTPGVFVINGVINYANFF